MLIEPQGPTIVQERTKQEAEYMRCRCGKIVCQTTRDSVIIKCRHCKRYIIIKTEGITRIEFC